jgi:uncharacterized membrane protein YqiK
MAVPMKKKPKLSALKAVRRRTGNARAGTKPDQAVRVKRAKAHRKSQARAAPADPKLTIRRLRSELARARSRIEQLEAAADQSSENASQQARALRDQAEAARKGSTN